MLEANNPNSYDILPYPRLSHKDTHPDRLFTLATLLGLNPPPIEHCRVLEIGCASGGNLIPMACTLPESEFVGIDFSVRQIQEGLVDIQALGITNVTLLKKDILDFDSSFGKFDYILAHGVYSWVPFPVRDKLLSICCENLESQGVAFVSYNVYPGWHSIDPIRQMMLYHTRADDDLFVKSTRGKELLDFLTNAVPPDTIHGANLHSNYDYLKRELDRNPTLNTSLLIHDHLSETNDPVYFYQFAEHASKHGLQYLCDSELNTDFLSGFKPENIKALLELSHDQIELEQYMDFVRNKRFRRSLLVHEDLNIERQIKIDRIFKLWVGSSANPESSTFDIDSEKPETFKGNDGAVLRLTHPLSKTAMLYLAQVWPAYISFHELVEAAFALLSASRNQVSELSTSSKEDKKYLEMVGRLGADLLQAYIYSDSLVEFHACEPPFTLDIENKPLSSAWARYESLAGTRVTNLRHERVDLDVFEILLLRLLDGTLDRENILDALADISTSNEISIQEDGKPITDGLHLRDVLSAALDTKLQQLARAALILKQ